MVLSIVTHLKETKHRVLLMDCIWGMCAYQRGSHNLCFKRCMLIREDTTALYSILGIFVP